MTKQKATDRTKRDAYRRAAYERFDLTKYMERLAKRLRGKRP